MRESIIKELYSLIIPYQPPAGKGKMPASSIEPINVDNRKPAFPYPWLAGSEGMENMGTTIMGLYRDCYKDPFLHSVSFWNCRRTS